MYKFVHFPKHEKWKRGEILSRVFFAPEEEAPKSTNVVNDNAIHVSMIVCGPSKNEAVTMIKTASMFTNHPVHFHIVRDPKLEDFIIDQVTTCERLFDSIKLYLSSLLNFNNKAR